MQKIFKLWMQLVTWGSSKGLPVFFLRDPKTNKPSVSLTLLIASFIFCILGLINTASHSKLFGDLDETSAFNLFIASSSLYFGRKLSGDKDSIVIDKDDTPDNPNKPQ